LTPPPKPPVRHRDILDTECLAALIDKGFNPNLMLPLGVYPLELAAWGRNLRSCEMLLAAGAKVDGSPDALRPIFPLTYATKGAGTTNASTMRAICSLLVAHGADLNGPQTVQSPLHAAAIDGNQVAVEILIAFGANVDHVTLAKNGRNPITVLERACWAKNEPMMITLLRAGADDRCLANGALTPFQQCVALGLSMVIEYYVREAGEDLNQRTSAGKSLVQLALRDSAKIGSASTKV
jgi:ankyrin repeat protein